MRAAAVGLALALCLATPAAPRTPRSTSELRAFQREHPCPSTGLHRGPCPGHQIDHANPLCAGGADRRENMQWLTDEEHRMKTRSDVRLCRLYRAAPK